MAESGRRISGDGRESPEDCWEMVGGDRVRVELSVPVLEGLVVGECERAAVGGVGLLGEGWLMADGG